MLAYVFYVLIRVKQQTFMHMLKQLINADWGSYSDLWKVFIFILGFGCPWESKSSNAP